MHCHPVSRAAAVVSGGNNRTKVRAASDKERKKFHSANLRILSTSCLLARGSRLLAEGVPARGRVAR
jgi:hypothetical protein